jgi:hypothetical protein
MAVQQDWHGEWQETRRLLASPALADYLDWLGLEQVLQFMRTVTRKGQTTQATHYSIASLTPERADEAPQQRRRG